MLALPGPGPDPGSAPASDPDCDLSLGLDAGGVASPIMLSVSVPHPHSSRRVQPTIMPSHGTRRLCVCRGIEGALKRCRSLAVDLNNDVTVGSDEPNGCEHGSTDTTCSWRVPVVCLD